MTIAVTSLLYLLAGLLLAIARRVRAKVGALQLGLTVALWPIFAPFVLAERQVRGRAAGSPLERRVHSAIQAVLDGIRQLEGTAAEVLAGESARIEALGAKLAAEARRVDGMGAALATPRFARSGDPTPDDPSAQARLQAAERLARLAEDTEAELLAGIGQLEATASQLVLLRFADPCRTSSGPTVDEVAAGIAAVAEAFHDPTGDSRQGAGGAPMTVG